MRGLVLRLVLLLSAFALPAAARELPPDIQARLLSKVPAYDRGFVARAGAEVGVLIVQNERPESRRGARQLKAALERLSSIAGLPFRVYVHSFEGQARLRKAVEVRGIDLVYLTPALGDALESICAALGSFNGLTISPVRLHRQRCVVVGWELVGGRPKLFIHLGRALRRGIRFRAELLELATVVR